MIPIVFLSRRAGDIGDLSSMAVRLRLYSNERLRRERLLGQAVVGLASLALDLQREQQLLVTLDSNKSSVVQPFKQPLKTTNQYHATSVFHSLHSFHTYMQSS